MTLLIQTLLKENLITRDQLNDARDKQRGAKKPVQNLLVEMGYLSEEDLLNVSSRVFNIPRLNVDEINPKLAELVSYDAAMRLGVVPVSKVDDTLNIAMSDPLDIMAIDEIKILTGLHVKPLLATKSKINELIETFYHSDDQLYSLLKNAVEDAKVSVIDSITKREDVIDVDSFVVSNDQAPVIRAVNLILSDAVKARATDIHIVPQEEYVSVQYRVDGELRDVLKISNRLLRFIVARIKIMTNLDVAESRKPQDGRSRISVNERKIDLRVSIVPAFYGEAVGMRILDPTEAKIEMHTIGCTGEEMHIITKSSSSPQGMLLVTGPTGSGKTSTLYAALNSIKGENKNIITIEDPIEYLLDNLTQVQVNPAKDVTFATALRSFLRQDPDAILVGEIRDKETAEIAFRASLTGHMVFSTVHTNSSVATIARLFDIGIEPYLVSTTLTLIIAQRLIKLICPECKEEVKPDGEFLDSYHSYIRDYSIKKFYHGAGCKHCNYTGYFGRTAIFELLQLNQNIRDLIASRAPEKNIFQEAKKNGMRSLTEAGFAKVGEGITTMAEIARVAGTLKLDEAVQKMEEKREHRKILIADDDEDILRVLEKCFTAVNYDVSMARDGVTLLERAIREKPDLIISDITMPKMDGYEVIQTLRSSLETATVPVIFLTGRQDKESELKGIEVGADDYITKPFDEDKLMARVKMLMRRLAP